MNEYTALVGPRKPKRNGNERENQRVTFTHGNFHSRTVHLDIIKVLFLKGVLKFNP